MKIAAKLVSAAILGIVMLSAINGVVRVRREIDTFDVDMRRDALHLARTTRDLIAEVWRLSGRDRALEILDGISAQKNALHVQFVWLDAPDDPIHAPALPLDRLAPVLHGEEFCVEDLKSLPSGRLLTYVPISVEPGRPAALELTESLVELRQYTNSTIRRVVVLTISNVAVSGAPVLLLGVSVIGRPLNRMCRALQAAQEQARAETEARIVTLEQLRQADRLETVGRLASGIAHELGTPLNVVAGRAALIASRKLPDEEVIQSAVTIRGQADRMTRLIRQLLDFARRGTPKRDRVERRTVIAETLYRKLQRDEQTDRPGGTVPSPNGRGRLRRCVFAPRADGRPSTSRMNWTPLSLLHAENVGAATTGAYRPGWAIRLAVTDSPIQGRNHRDPRVTASGTGHDAARGTAISPLSGRRHAGTDHAPFVRRG